MDSGTHLTPGSAGHPAGRSEKRRDPERYVTPVRSLTGSPPSISQAAKESIGESETETLRRLISDIETWSDKSDDRILAAARNLKELRIRVEAGDAGNGVKWMEWALANINLKPRQLRYLQTIGESKHPKTELERTRKLGCERVRKHRERKAAAERMREPERRLLAEWARVAPIGDVSNFWRQINRLMAARQDLSGRRVSS